MPQSHVTQIILAPMEGVLDGVMRNLLTSVNQYDLCITEFVRVVQTKVPKQIFYRICPELRNGGVTTNGTPVRVQLLGQNPTSLAENAIRAIELGSHGIDLNFGCPAKTVNKSQGGAVLLQYPDKIAKIIETVKSNVGKNTPVSVKIRLGYNDDSLFNEVIAAINETAPAMLTVHARTKKQGYKPPAHWHYLADLHQKLSCPLVANGEIWSKSDALQCMSASKTTNIMLGRGALALPNLANVIRFDEAPMTWPALTELFKRYAELELYGEKSFYFSSRVKQWLRYLKIQYTEAEHLFEQIKTVSNKAEIINALDAHLT